jgi:hypothetical protein
MGLSYFSPIVHTTNPEVPRCRCSKFAHEPNPALHHHRGKLSCATHLAAVPLSLSLFFSKKKDEVQVYCICCGILSHGFWGGKIRGREMGGTRRKESENEAETRAMRDRLEGRAHPGHTTPPLSCFPSPTIQPSPSTNGPAPHPACRRLPGEAAAHSPPPARAFNSPPPPLPPSNLSHPLLLLLPRSVVEQGRPPCLAVRFGLV